MRNAATPLSVTGKQLSAKPLLCKRWGSNQQRHFHLQNGSSSRAVDDEVEVNVKVGISRQIQLRIRQPPRPQGNNPIIIFFNPGIPVARQTSSDIGTLAAAANATVVDLQYGLSKDTPYPYPIHATLAGFDWIQRNLAKSISPAHTGAQSTIRSLKIGVCGELVGASLASMLALTECHDHPIESEPPGIGAVALGNPILDWTALFATGSKPLPSSSSNTEINKETDLSAAEVNCEALISTSSLSSLRDSIFPKPEKYLDPFASPLLFFRTPSSDLPDDTETGDMSGSDDDNVQRNGHASIPSKLRYYHRKYPPSNSDLLMPSIRVEIGKGFNLKDQGADLVNCMQKSFDRAKRERVITGEERTFETIERKGLGVWNEKQTFEVGQWLGTVLRGN